MNVNKESEKSKEIIDVNSTVNNLLEKIADSVISPNKANVKNLIEIRDLFSELKEADKSSKYSIFPEVKDKIDKANKILSNVDTINIPKKDFINTDKKQLEEIGTNNINKIIKSLNEAIQVIEGTKKLSEDIEIPKDVSKRIMEEIVFSLLGKQLKSYYQFIFPDKESKDSKVLDITPISEKKIEKNIPETQILEKKEVEIKKIDNNTEKDSQEVNISNLESINKNNKEILKSDIKIEKKIYNVNQFPDFIEKLSNKPKDVGNILRDSSANKEIKSQDEIKEYDRRYIPRKQEDEIKNDLTKENKFIDNINTKIKTNEKSINELKDIKQVSEKLNNEISNKEIVNLKSTNELNVSEINDLKYTEAGQIDASDKILIPNLTQKIENDAPSITSKIQKDEINLTTIDKKDLKSNSSENNIVNIEIDKGKKDATPDSSGNNSSIPLLYADKNQLNLSPQEALTVENLYAKPADFIDKNQQEIGSVNKTIKSNSTHLVSSNIFGISSAETEITAAIANFFSSASAFDYAKAFVTEYNAQQLKIKMLAVENYDNQSDRMKPGQGFYKGDDSLDILFKNLNEFKEKIENKKTILSGPGGESQTRQDELNDPLINKIIDIEIKRADEKDKHKDRCYKLEGHPQCVGYIKVYTKRSIRFQDSLSEIHYLPFQFEPKIGGDGKGANYSQISTLARSSPAQIYKNSGERKVTLEIDYLVTAASDSIRDSKFKDSPYIDSISAIGMESWTEDYIYNYLIRNFRALTLPNMADPKFRLGPPIIQVWYGGLNSSNASSAGLVEDSKNSELNDVHPTFRTNWYTRSVDGKVLKYNSIRSLWNCENVSFDFKGGVINPAARRTTNVTVSLSLTEIAPAITDNELMIWAPIIGIPKTRKGPTGIA